MERTRRFVWGSAGVMVVLSVIGLLVVDASAQVHTKFSFDGWTTSYSRNTSLAIWAGAALLVATAMHFTLATNEGLPWLRYLAIALMTLLPVTQLLSIIEAA